MGGANPGISRQSMGTVNPGRQSMGGANPGVSRQSMGTVNPGRQSFGGANPGSERQSVTRTNPGAGRQSMGSIQSGSRVGSNRTQGIQGNTRSFNNNNRISAGGRPSVGGATRITPSRTGANRAYYSNGRSYYGRNYYYGGRANYGFGYNSYSPWAVRSGFYYNRGFYSSLYYPRLGLSFGYLPYGYYPFYWADMQFYYGNGYFYQYNNNQYTIVEPPIGAAVNTLPSGAESIVINGIQYYELNGVYYQPVVKDNGTTVYQVVGKDGQLETDEPILEGYNGDSGSYNMGPAPQMGDIVSQLPDDTRRININGQKYLVSPDDYYYQETRDNNNDKVYKVVGTPDDAPGN
ncbi:MAG: hypothetical protein EOP47_16205 [Sphingobacteriaceae bacterium]|nr:MAG: hypothetical protein EOP47_16205 [Sphingobacteriaceae bacterium]